MDRQYYVAKFGIVVVAVALAFAGAGMGTASGNHEIGTRAGLSAPAQFQAATWHATARATRLIACLLSHPTQANS